MSKRKIDDVSPRGEGWAVKQRGAKRAVVVRTRDGSIHTSGGDPHLPRG